MLQKADGDEHLERQAGEAVEQREERATVGKPTSTRRAGAKDIQISEYAVAVYVQTGPGPAEIPADQFLSRARGDDDGRVQPAGHVIRVAKLSRYGDWRLDGEEVIYYDEGPTTDEFSQLDTLSGDQGASPNSEGFAFGILIFEF